MRIGIDLGGTKIAIMVLDDEGNVLLEDRKATPQGDYHGTLQAVTGLVLMAEQQLGCIASVGIGTPGALSPATGLLRNANSVCLNGQPFKQDLQTLLNREIRMANDANCFALSEAVDGAACDANTVFGVIIGTGTGGGLVVNRQVLAGRHGIAGEWGHNPLPWMQTQEFPGSDCYCGKQGCIETWLSGPGLSRQHQLRTGEQLTAQQIAENAIDDDVCEASLQHYERCMARALAGVMNIFDPDVIVLGGGLSKLQRLYQNVPSLWREYVFSDVIETDLRAPVYGDASGVRGAAWLW